MSVSSKSSKKPPRRGLKKAIKVVLDKGLSPPSFGVDEIQKGLSVEGWAYEVDYNMNSMVHAIKDLIVDGVVAWKKNVKNNTDKVWSYTSGQVSSSLIPLQGSLDKMVEDLADEVVSRVRQRAREKLGL
jgi:hypothetical protein